MRKDHIPDWHPELHSDRSGEIRQRLERVDATTSELKAAWSEFNKAQRVGRPRKGPERDSLIKLANELASELNFLQPLFDSDTLESTNDYLIVLTAQQELLYSLDRLGMV